MATREADGTVYTHAGPEIGVASTKAFTSQLVALHLLALAPRPGARHARARRWRGTLIEQLDQLPLRHRGGAEGRRGRSRRWRPRCSSSGDFLYLGRGINYPIALEGALKLKEISYIHAEGYPAGEMKHGPIALIDEDLPVVALAADDAVFEKVIGNIQEAKARGGRIIVVTNASKVHGLRRGSATGARRHPAGARRASAAAAGAAGDSAAAARVPRRRRRGCDVDQPRNLAKSVTVE